MSNEPQFGPGREPGIPGGGGPGGPPGREFRTALRLSRIAAVSFFVDLLFLFGFVAFIAGRVRLRVPVQDRSTIQIIRVALFLAAAASVLGCRLLNGRMLQAARRAAGERARLALLNRTTLVSLALSMIPAVIGFVLYLVAGQVRDFMILAFASLLLLFFYFPRPAAWESILADRIPSCRL